MYVGDGEGLKIIILNVSKTKVLIPKYEKIRISTYNENGFWHVLLANSWSSRLKKKKKKLSQSCWFLLHNCYVHNFITFSQSAESGMNWQV